MSNLIWLCSKQTVRELLNDSERHWLVPENLCNADEAEAEIARLREALQEAVDWIEDDRFDDEYIIENWYHKALAVLREPRVDAAKWREAEIARKDELLKIAIEGLEEARSDIDVDIDAQYPADAHPLYAEKNKWLRAGNPARVALEKIRNHQGNEG